MDSLTAIVLALAPSIGIGYLFYRILRALLEGDRNERLAHARWLAQQDGESADAHRTPPGPGRAHAHRPVKEQGPTP